MNCIILWERLSRPPRLSESDGGQAAAIRHSGIRLRRISMVRQAHHPERSRRGIWIPASAGMMCSCNLLSFLQLDFSLPPKNIF